MRLVWLIYLLLLAVSIPWYLPEAIAEQIVVGFPLWAWVTLGSYVAAAFFTLYAIEVAWRDDS